MSVERKLVILYCDDRIDTQNDRMAHRKKMSSYDQSCRTDESIAAIESNVDTK